MTKKTQKALEAVRTARLLHNDGRFDEAEKYYQDAADNSTGFAKNIMERHVEDCKNRKPFTGQIKGIHYH